MIKFYLKKNPKILYSYNNKRKYDYEWNISEAENDKKIIPFLITIVLINNPII